MATKRTLLVTGATGGMGSDLTRRLASDYELVRHAHRPRPEDPDLAVVDLADEQAVVDLMQGVDTVLHLAGASSPESDWDAVLQTNIVGTRNVLEGARRAGVRRVVYASSNHAMGMYDRLGQWPVYHQDLPRPDSLYGVSKVFGETLGRFYHDEYGLDFISLRIGWAAEDPMATEVDVLRAMWLSQDDAERAVRCAVEAEVTFGLYYAVSDNPNRRWDLTNTMLELGYRPQDSWVRFAGVTEDVVEGGASAPSDWPAGS